MSAESTTPPSNSQSAETVFMKVDWSALDEIPLQSVNVFLAQGIGEDEVALWFGRIEPPVAAALPGKRWEDEERIPVHPGARLTMSRRVARNLMAVLRANLEAEAAEAEEGE